MSAKSLYFFRLTCKSLLTNRVIWGKSHNPSSVLFFPVTLKNEVKHPSQSNIKQASLWRQLWTMTRTLLYLHSMSLPGAWPVGPYRVDPSNQCLGSAHAHWGSWNQADSMPCDRAFPASAPLITTDSVPVEVLGVTSLYSLARPPAPPPSHMAGNPQPHGRQPSGSSVNASLTPSPLPPHVCFQMEPAGDPHLERLHC